MRYIPAQMKQINATIKQQSIYCDRYSLVPGWWGCFMSIEALSCCRTDDGRWSGCVVIRKIWIWRKGRSSILRPLLSILRPLLSSGPSALSSYIWFILYIVSINKENTQEKVKKCAHRECFSLNYDQITWFCLYNSYSINSYINICDQATNFLFLTQIALIPLALSCVKFRQIIEKDSNSSFLFT